MTPEIRSNESPVEGSDALRKDWGGCASSSFSHALRAFLRRTEIETVYRNGTSKVPAGLYATRLTGATGDGGVDQCLRRGVLP